jgi:hypothetical protein
VAEFVSPGSKRTDHVAKRADYADAGIPHYWIVDLDDPISLVACHLGGELGYVDDGAVTGTFTTTRAVPRAARSRRPRLRQLVGTATTSTIAPLRSTVTGSGTPIASPKSWRWMPWASSTGRRPTSSTRSPARRPACAAGLPPITSAEPQAVAAAVPVGHRGGHRRRAADDAQVGAAHAAVGEQCGDDPARGRVHRHREPQPTPGHRRVDPDHRARESASAPPELPGLSAASVWITSSTTRRARPRGSAATARAR